MTFEDEDEVRRIVRDEIQSSFNFESSLSELKTQISELERKANDSSLRYEIAAEIERLKNDLESLKTSIRHGGPIW